MGFQERGRIRFTTLALAMGCLVLAGAAVAQETTGSLVGMVLAKSDNSPLPGVTIEAIHQPTGAQYLGVSQANGRFSILNVKVGGPYIVTATLSGFIPQGFEDVRVSLGETRDLLFEMEEATLTETIEVTAEANPLISPDRMGSGSAVSREQIQILPTMRRQLQDFARLNPYFATQPYDETGTVLSVAGKNNRYNSIQVDGAVNNDLFGLASSGTPGGQTDAQPVSLDSIQELQLVISPYDVKQGGFTGGAINAITRSGSNDFHGSVYGSKRDPKYVGDGPLDREIADFKEDQYGATFGGRILRDTLFFFASVERNRRSQPTGVSADGSTTTDFNKPLEAADFKAYLISEYDYDPGTLGDFGQRTDSDMAFLRLDLNISTAHKVTLRHNYVDALRDQVGDRSSTQFRFDTAIYAIADKTNSTVFQINSVLGTNAFNLGRIGYQTIKDDRAVPVIFPTVDIGTTSRRPDMTAGTERFSGANSLDQDILEVTDDLSLVMGDHTITIGTSNQIFDFKNLFLSDFYGFYRFNTLADFKAGVAQDYSITFANGSDPRRPTAFGAEQYSLYAGDTWRAASDLTFTFGLRLDYPRLGDKPSRNQGVLNTFGIDTSDVPTDTLAYSPRFGFNWALGEMHNQQLRGGIGVFVGRTPFVWISNAYGNTGIETTSLSSRNVTFNPDPYSQPKNFPPGTGAISVDGVDPDFQFPRVWRATLGYDRELPLGIRGTVEAMYTRTIKDVYYYNMNKTPTGAVAFDGRPTFKNVASGYRDIPYLANTNKGEQTTLTFLFEKRFDFGLYFNASYIYMDAKAAFEGTSSRAISNWQYHATRGDIFEQELSRSFWEIEDRFNFVVSQTFATGPVTHNVALFYNIESGRPYSIMMGGDPNKDGYTSNDLIFVPANTSDIIITNGTAADFDAFLSWTGLDKYRGQVAPRNSATSPWNRSLDFHYDILLPIKVVDAQLTFDILNLINFIDSDKGALRYVSNQSYTPINYDGIDSATGKAKYRIAFTGALNEGRAFSIQDLRSRWQAKFGFRLSF